VLQADRYMTQENLQATIKAAMKTALKAGDKPRLGTVRLMMAEMKRVEVDERIELDDERVLAILDKMLKQRRDSFSQYQAAAREDLASQEAFEISVIEEFMPAKLDEAELDAMVRAAISDSGASSMQDMGSVMALVKPQAQGRADMGAVSKMVKALLQ
jgi:uncharacterized protein